MREREARLARAFCLAPTATPQARGGGGAAAQGRPHHGPVALYCMEAVSRPAVGAGDRP
jgi:hypothetical protein